MVKRKTISHSILTVSKRVCLIFSQLKTFTQVEDSIGSTRERTVLLLLILSIGCYVASILTKKFT